MALTLEELCAGTENEYGMKLIAGKNGTDNMVRWVHYIEGGETPRFLHGYELIFTTGMENQYSTWLLKFAEKLHEYGACGLVINIGPYVGDVPEDVREYCDKVSLPLYTIPWETRIVDITYEMCHHIVTDEKQSRSVAESVIYAINNPMKKEDCAAELENAGFSDSMPTEVADLPTIDAREGVRCSALQRAFRTGCHGPRPIPSRNLQKNNRALSDRKRPGFISSMQTCYSSRM